MKNITLSLIALFSLGAFAAPVGSTFNGAGVNLDLTTVKYKSAGFESKQATGVNLGADYAFDYQYNLVGIAEAKAKIGSSKIGNDLTQKSQFALGYLQGYRISTDLLPYAKLNYNLSKVSEIGSFKGFGYGLGAKYAVSSDIEIGAEYMRNNLKYHGNKLKGNAFSATAGYRF